MCLPLSVVVSMRVGTSLLGSHFGLTRAVSDGVHALLGVDVWSARIKAVGQGNSVGWLRAYENAKQSPTAPARLQVTPIT